MKKIGGSCSKQRCNSRETFGATPAMSGQNLPHLVGISTSWNRVKVSENLDATD